MSNTHFQFKQFTIQQERCAMKVTTDACIQGAWTPTLSSVKRVLDIGAGTGLLSLMLAQRTSGTEIDAIELDGAAANQATENIAASPWKERITMIQGDVCNYAFPQKYDLIITNPPFFNDSLLSGKAAKDNARHTTSLTHTSLLEAIAANLSEGGYYSILLPVAEYEGWAQLAEKKGWHCIGKLSVSHRPGAAVKRVVGLFSKNSSLLLPNELLTIQEQGCGYTPRFTDLLAPFYLSL